MDNLFYVYGEFQTLYLNNYSPRDPDAISVKYISKLTPKLILPAFNIGIFFEYFLIKFSSFLVKPVVPITTLFLSFDAILRISSVHFGTVKSTNHISFFKS